MKKALIRNIAILLAILTPMMAFAGIIGKSHAKTTMDMEEFEALISAYSILPDSVSYREYKKTFQEVFPSDAITVSAADYVRYEEGGEKMTPQVFTDYEGAKGRSVLTSENSLIEMEFQVFEEGFYNITLEYYPVAGKNADIERSVLIDGALPYEEMSLVSFHRIWKYDVLADKMENGAPAYKWARDNQGNDNKPAMVEKPEWIRQYVYDSDGYVTEPLAVYLTKGTHEITLISVREPMLLKSISFDNQKKLDPYVQVKAMQDAAGAKNSYGTLLVIEGENATKTSSQMLYPIQDQSSPSVSPSSPKELLNNTIGGNSWRLEGQWIEWEFEVP
ncbi:MAG: ABC transporter substrate-binding protein, partial [Lachnospiraceae bacterium]|nr:ABC transporter substrate-binding protein [Lachnospiraceae bacterium]